MLQFEAIFRGQALLCEISVNRHRNNFYIFLCCQLGREVFGWRFFIELSKCVGK